MTQQITMSAAVSIRSLRSMERDELPESPRSLLCSKLEIDETVVPMPADQYPRVHVNATQNQPPTHGSQPFVVEQWYERFQTQALM